ncbi:hypothetical protein Tco_0588611 [Tanacetum coccineum]
MKLRMRSRVKNDRIESHLHNPGIPGTYKDTTTWIMENINISHKNTINYYTTTDKAGVGLPTKACLGSRRIGTRSHEFMVMGNVWRSGKTSVWSRVGEEGHGSPRTFEPRGFDLSIELSLDYSLLDPEVRVGLIRRVIKFIQLNFPSAPAVFEYQNWYAC